MSTNTYPTYAEATQAYLSRFRALRDEPPVVLEAVTRGAGDIPAEVLIQRAGEIAEVSAGMVPLAREYLAAPDPTLREGISGQLLAQAAAEMQVAVELFEIAASQASGSAEANAGTVKPVTRAVRGANLWDAIDKMVNVMDKPISAGLDAPGRVTRTATVTTDLDEAKQALLLTASVTTGAISQRVVEVGGDIAFNLVFKTEWTAVIESAGLLSKDVAKLLDRIKEGASDLIKHAVMVAARTILNVYDKVLALLGKDIQDLARQQVQKWLEEVQNAGEIELFEQLVGKLYQVDRFKEALPQCLDSTTASMDKINTTTAEVDALSGKFTVLVGRINAVGDVIGLSKFIQAQFPQVLAIVTAIRVALLAVLVYSGYDYIGYEQASFLNLTKGVGEVIRSNLCENRALPSTPAPG